MTAIEKLYDLDMDRVRHETLWWVSCHTPDLILNSDNPHTKYLTGGTYIIYDLQKGPSGESPVRKEMDAFSYSHFVDNVPEYLKFIIDSTGDPLAAHIAIMGPETTIRTHKDTAHKKVYRHHIPVFTNTDSDMVVGSKPTHMDDGLWYLDVGFPHSAYNNSKTKSRWHITWMNKR